MISELEISQGDVVVVPFPYTYRLTEKRRPALVVSNGKITKQHGLVWLAMITSAENNRWPDDILLTGENLGLSAPSVIRIAKLATIDPAQIIRIAGKIDAELLAQVHAAMEAQLT